MTDGYTCDFHRWAETQAGLLRTRSSYMRDWDKLAEASYPAGNLAEAYVSGHEDTGGETGLPRLPDASPGTVEPDFLPGLPWEADEP
jgi:hypothetical protein